MRAPEPLSAPAPAKINLVLEVTGRRPDGYHQIDSILQTLELADRVTVVTGGAAPVTVGGPCAEGTPADETNLAWRAVLELARITGHRIERVSIALEKHVPAAGGLGGGASDAATTLRLLQRAWPGVTDGDLSRAAAAVGSDEAFFLAGGTARATGRGEVIDPLPPISPRGVVLFIPPATIERKTARMFAALDRLRFDDGTVATSFVAEPPPQVCGADVFNAFERVAFDVFEGLGRLWGQIEARVGEPVRLAGAGPTLFWIGPPAQAGAVAAAAEGLLCTVVPTATARSLWTR